MGKDMPFEAYTLRVLKLLNLNMAVLLVTRKMLVSYLFLVLVVLLKILF